MDRGTFLSELGEDFIDFADILRPYKSLENISEKLYDLCGKLQRRDFIGYKVEDIIIVFDELEKFPKKLSHHNSAIDLILKFNIKLEIDYDNLINGNDPFNDFSFNIVITGRNKNNQNSKLSYAIHFDRHNLKEERESIEKRKGRKPLQPHPVYHFQFGGNELKDKEIDHGQALFLDSPRIMHHPMELILGIDFILSNFFPRIWDKIKGERRYKKILKKYQKYFIQPYFQSIANSFDSALTQNWNAQEIYPQLIR